MIATQLQTHTQDALDRLLSSLKGRPVLSGIISALGNEAQSFENAAFPIAAGRMLVDGNAVGAQLDGIGALVGLPRGAVPDSEYRLLLLATIAANNSKADRETLLRIAQILFAAASASVISPESPGHSQHRGAASIGLEIESPTVDPSLYALVTNIFQKSIAANVALSWIDVNDGATAFALDGPQPGLGLDDLNNPGNGGKLSNLIFSNAAN